MKSPAPQGPPETGPERAGRESLSRLDLPVVPWLDRIESALETRGALVLQAEPGAGKTTIVPPALLGARFLGGGRIVMLEPRRIAAAAAAARIAEILGEELGATAGYAVRHERRVGRATRIEVVTEGLLDRRLLDDPALPGVGLVILDEFHERSVQADLALALLLDVRELRPDLRLLVMSATLDATRVARFIGCPSLAVPGRVHPVETRHESPRGGLLARRDRRGLAAPAGFDAAAVARAALDALEETGGDVLVFLAGAREIRRVQAHLERGARGAEIARLHGSMPLAEQRAVTRPRAGGPPRIVLATNVAETSLTVPGVRAVVDSGWARVARFHPRSGMNRLVTERVSAAAADQRRGRAGRLGPGLCIRCWDPREKLAPETPPEIARSELSATVLAAALWGARDPARLRFLDPPPAALWEAARELLRGLGALDAQGASTGRGAALARIGLAPRLAALVERGRESGRFELACACAALLAGDDRPWLAGDDRPWLAGDDRPWLAGDDRPWLAGDADFRLRLAGLRDSLGAGAGEAHARARREYAHLLGRRGGRGRGEGAAPAWGDDDCGPLLLAAFPDRLAQRVERALFRLASGRAARLQGSLAEEPFVVAVEADAGEATGTIHLAAPVSREAVEATLAHLIEEDQEITWEGWTPRARVVRRVGRVVLSDRGTGRPDPAAVERAVALRLREQGVRALPWSQRSRQLLERGRHAARSGRVPGLPGWSDEELAAGVDEWLLPFLRRGGGPLLDEAAVERALRARIPGPAAAALAREAPESLLLPSGSRRAIRYGEGDPCVDARIQELFGMAASPVVCGAPVVFRLLSPAGRPLQITSDLASFWRTAYPELRGSLRARYPRHDWPEDPLAARPGPGPRRRPPRGR